MFRRSANFAAHSVKFAPRLALRKFSTEPLKKFFINNNARGERFKDVWESVTFGSASIGAVVGGGSLASYWAITEEPWVVKPAAFTLGGIIGGFSGTLFGILSGASVGIPIALIAEFPVAGTAIITSGVTAAIYTNRNYLFSPKKPDQTADISVSSPTYPAAKL